MSGSSSALGFTTTTPEVDLDSLPVTGRLPQWLEGTLIRNGPGTFDVGQQRYRHWFDGLAMLHRFAVKDGTVSYSNRFLETRAYQEARQTGQISYSEFATDPCRSLFARATAVFDPKVTDSAKVNVARLADRYLALAETPIQVEFDPETLRSVGVFGYEPKNLGRMTTVHPHIDAVRREAFNLVTRYGAVSEYRFHRLDTSDRALPRQRIARTVVAEPGYIHSFGMTERYLVLAEFPLVVNPVSLLLWLRPYIENFRWKPRRGTRLWVFDRATGALVKRHETEAFFAFHHVNAYEVGDEVVVDIVGYDDDSIISAFYLDRLAEPDLQIPHGRLHRLRLPLTGKRPAVIEVVSDTCIELPSLDYARYNANGEYSVLYGIGLSRDEPRGFYNQLVKLDARSGETRTWSDAGCFPGEGVFVGRPDRRREDDGVVLSVVLDSQRGTSYLLVLDAMTFTELGRAEIPHPVLHGYHGQFFAEP